MATKGTREQEARKDGEAWPVGRGARGSGATAVWGQLPTTPCVSKGKRDLDSGHCGNDAFLHTDEFNMIQTYIHLLKHNMASRLCFYVIVNN